MLFFDIYGSKNPMRDNLKYKEPNSKSEALLENIKKYLPDEQKAILIELEDLQCEMETGCALEYFKSGFKRGVTLICGCMDEI